MWRNPLTLGSMLLVGVLLCDGIPTDDSPDMMLDWTDDGPPTTRVFQKRATSPSSHDSFVEDKLAEQSQALEYLVKLAQESNESLKRLAENISHRFIETKVPEKLEVEPSRRNYDKKRLVPDKNVSTTTKNPIVETLVNNPIVNMSKKMPQYGLLAKTLFMSSLESDTDPTPTRRAGGKPVKDKKQYPWCQIALFCSKDRKEVCGYDEVFGHGKFDDFCHMVEVNCYWNHNFALTPSCKLPLGRVSSVLE